MTQLLGCSLGQAHPKSECLAQSWLLHFSHFQLTVHPGNWAPATWTGDSDRALDSWLCPGPALAVVGTWGVNQRMEGLFLSNKVQINSKILNHFFKKVCSIK